MILLLQAFGANAQLNLDNNEVYKITYSSSFNGKTREHQNKTWVFAGATQTLITNEKDFTKKSPYPFEVSVADHKKTSWNYWHSWVRKTLFQQQTLPCATSNLSSAMKQNDPGVYL